MVRMEAVTRHYRIGGQVIAALDGVSFMVPQGQFMAIVGPSGSGKSTLLNMLGCLDRPDSGRYLLDDVDVSTFDDERASDFRNRRIGFVFQSFHLLPALTAEENVMLPLELEGVGDARTRARAALEAVGLTARRRHYPAQLSGGEQQRVAIARAFASEAQILFADEPTGNLDSTTGARIIELLFSLNQEYATTLVLVTHDERLARQCHRTIRLVAGEVVNDSALAGVADAS